MRIERAIDEFLNWRRLERDATPSSIESYRRILWKLADDYPEVEIDFLTTDDLRRFLNRWLERSAATRSNVISVLHSFFSWAEGEDLIDVDPSRKIRRPPKRKPDVYRPSLDELSALRAAAAGYERPPILLMEGAGLRSAEVRAVAGRTSTSFVDASGCIGRARIGIGSRSTRMCSKSFGTRSGS